MQRSSVNIILFLISPFFYYHYFPSTCCVFPLCFYLLQSFISFPTDCGSCFISSNTAFFLSDTMATEVKMSSCNNSLHETTSGHRVSSMHTQTARRKAEWGNQCLDSCWYYRYHLIIKHWSEWGMIKGECWLDRDGELGWTGTDRAGRDQ